ncbi:MAG: valine--tRNA ligase [Thermoplasmata archaeon]
MAEPTLQGKRWEPTREEELLHTWESDLYRFDPESGKPVFTIDTPPPYPSGMSWHIGAVASYSLIDMIARSLRMRGYEVLFPFGLDRNGINIERTVERKYDKPLYEWDRQEFIDVCRTEVDRQSQVYLRTAHRIGFSADFDDHYYETDSPEYRAMSQGIFIHLFNQGYFYRDLRPTFYCPGDRTPVAEADIEYEIRSSKLVHIVFQGEDGPSVTIATTRPELLFACDAVVVHPDDERYTTLHGSTLLVPPLGKSVKVRPHPAADPEFGTGAAMICSYGDTTDIQLFRELELTPVAAIDEEGRMTAEAGAYRGMTVAEAREAITVDLEREGVVEKVEELAHKTPVCGRSGDAIEFVQTEDWYMRQLDVLPELRKLASEMAFHPDRHRQLLLDWIDALTIDWPVGRRRYYHTEIPLWYCEGCGEALAPEPGPYYRPWKNPAPFEACPHCGGTAFEGEEGVFDTWMDSSNSNLRAALYDRDDAFFRAHFPASLRPQGRDIVRNWLYYTLLKSYRLLGQKPFEHVFIHGMGLDKLGRAMHDSLGNVVEPGPIFEKHGVDAFRFWAASETNVGEDFRVSEERIGGAKKFLTKLWNVARFISTFPEAEEGDLPPTERWILAELNTLIEEARVGYEDFNFFVPANRIRDFLWNLFAPHYIEMVKHRAYEGDRGSLHVLHRVLRTLLRLLAPICPFITDAIWREMYGGSVHREAFPEPREAWQSVLRDLTPTLVDFNSSVWREKKERRLTLKDGIAGVSLPKELEPFAEDLSQMHHILG